MIIRLGKNDIDGDKRLCIFIGTYILASSLNIAIKTILPIPESIWGLISLSFGAIIIVSLVICLPTLLYRAKNGLILLEVIFLFLYLYSFLLGYAKTDVLRQEAFWTLAICIPLCQAGCSVANKKILFRSIQLVAFIEYPILCIALLSVRTTGAYSMSTSYALVLPILLLIYVFFEERKKIALVFAIVGSLLILTFGARGPLLCIAVYVVIKLFSKKGDFHTIILRLLFVVLIGAVIIFWKQLMLKIQSFLSLNQISSYGLQRLISGTFSETSGRNELWQYYFNLLKEKPITGYGILGGWISLAEGPHNTLLEILLAFGVVGGSIVSIYLIYLLMTAFFSKKKASSELIRVLAAYNVTMYLVSGSWLEKPMFFLFVALSITSNYSSQSNRVAANRNTVGSFKLKRLRGE